MCLCVSSSYQSDQLQHSESPGTPNKPDTPGTTHTPDTPDIPVIPDTPGTPGTPGTSKKNESPDTSDIPDTPGTPNTRLQCFGQREESLFCFHSFINTTNATVYITSNSLNILRRFTLYPTTKTA